MNINGKEWQMVPTEPTPEMIDAFANVFNDRRQQQTFVPAVRAMLAAAPPPPVVEVTDEIARGKSSPMYSAELSAAMQALKSVQQERDSLKWRMARASLDCSP